MRYLVCHSEAPNTPGVCTPARAVRWLQTPRGMESRLNGVLIDRYTDDENASYPTLCKGASTSTTKIITPSRNRPA